MTKQQIDAAVRERLRKANEYIITRNGVDPCGHQYLYRKNAIIYAWEHNMTYREALAVFKKKKENNE